MRGGEPVTIDFMGLETPNKNAKEKCGVHDLSWIKPQMMQQVLSMRGFCEPKQQTSNAHTHSPAPPDCNSETAPLTIFYQGTVNVYNVSADKAKSLFLLAGGENNCNHLTSMRRKGEEEGSEMKDSDQKFTAVLEEDQIQKLRADLPLARKQSLQRFLQKRKHRLMMAAPYSHEVAKADEPQA